MSFNRIASHRIASHRIASHRIASHRIASHYNILLNFINFLSKIVTKKLFQPLEIVKYINAFSFGIAIKNKIGDIKNEKNIIFTDYFSVFNCFL